MDLTRWKKVEEVYYATRELSSDEREPFLRAACGDDGELRREVEELLAPGEEAGSLLEHSPVTPPPSITAVANSAGNLVNKRIGTFEVLELIGAGGMGDVYRARDTRLERFVAIKILPPHWMAEPDSLARFHEKLPAGLAQIIRKSLEKDRDLRYQTASDLHADLKRLKRDMEKVELAVAAPQPRQRQYITALAIFIAAAALGVTGWLWVNRPGPAIDETQLTAVPLTSYPGEEWYPSFSPDGGTLAFTRIRDGNNADLYLLHLGKGYSPLGDPERIVLDNPPNWGAVWMPNGREIVFVSGTRRSQGLWRMMVSKPATRRRLAFATSDVFCPAVSQQGNRLAYMATTKGDTNIWRIDLTGPDRRPSVPVRFISSTRPESMPVYSPDGKRIAFISERSGSWQIWICDNNGSKATQLTSLEETVYSPRWSWDNQTIAFTSAKKNMQGDVYVISANGGVPRRLTTHPAEDKWPYWSRNGQWIYFTSTRSGEEEIWKMPPSGGEAVRITRNGGDVPQESPDGKTIYYMKGYHQDIPSVWRMPVEGGKEAQVLDSVHTDGQWTAANDGIYFFRKPDDKRQSDLCLYEFATSKIRKILTIEIPVEYIAASPDSKTILYSQVDGEPGNDLMLVENFR